MPEKYVSDRKILRRASRRGAALSSRPANGTVERMGRSAVVCAVVLACMAACGSESDAPSEHAEVLRALEGISNRLDAIELELARSMEADRARSQGPVPKNGFGFGLDDDEPTAEGPPPPRAVAIALRGPEIFLGDRKVSTEELTEALEATKRAHHRPTVTIRSEKDVPHADLAAVLEIVQRVGIKQIGLATHASDDAPEEASWD